MFYYLCKYKVWFSLFYWLSNVLCADCCWPVRSHFLYCFHLLLSAPVSANEGDATQLQAAVWNAGTLVTSDCFAQMPCNFQIQKKVEHGALWIWAMCLIQLVLCFSLIFYQLIPDVKRRSILLKKEWIINMEACFISLFDFLGPQTWLTFYSGACAKLFLSSFWERCQLLRGHKYTWL